MLSLHASQVKAARAILGWSQGDLAEKANVSRSTIRILEEDKSSVRTATLIEIQKALEVGGVEFLENEGVRRATDGVKVYKGEKKAAKYFWREDALQVIKEKGGDIFAYITSHGILTRIVAKSNNFGKLESVRQSIKIKCLSPNTPSADFFVPPFQFRKPHENIIGPSCYLVYGDKRADVCLDGNKNPIFVVYNGAASMAADYRKHLLSLWENALPHEVKTHTRKQRLY